MVEPEVAYADIDDVMDLAEDFMVEVVKYVLDNGGDSISRSSSATSASSRTSRSPSPA